jgi:hypothetical protein
MTLASHKEDSEILCGNDSLKDMKFFLRYRFFEMRNSKATDVLNLSLHFTVVVTCNESYVVRVIYNESNKDTPFFYGKIYQIFRLNVSTLIYLETLLMQLKDRNRTFKIIINNEFELIN